MSFTEFLRIVQTGGQPMIGVGLAVVAYFLFRLHNTLLAFKDEIAADRIETAHARTELYGRVGVLEKTTDDHSRRLYILEKK